MELCKKGFFIGSKDIVETFAKENSRKFWAQTAIMFDELIFSLKENKLDLFKVKIVSMKLGVSERFARKGINALVDLKILSKERTKTFTYIVNTDELLKKLNFKNLQELFISRTRYVSSAIFNILKNIVYSGICPISILIFSLSLNFVVISYFLILLVSIPKQSIGSKI